MASVPLGAALMGPPMGQPGQPGMPAEGAAPAMDPNAQAAGMPQPGAPPPPQQTGNVTMDDMLSQADQQAQQIMTMDPASRRTQLVQLKHSNEALHAQVTSRLKTYEQAAGQQGIVQARQGGQPPTV